MPKKRTHAQEKKKVDEWFSKYTRWKAADIRGNCTCYTCNRVYHASKIQAGHFLSRRFAATRWNETNVKSQCYACNILRSGEQWLFGCRIESEEPGRTAQLMREADRGRKYTIRELRNLHDHYRTKALEFAEAKDVQPKPKGTGTIRRAKKGKTRPVKREHGKQHQGT